MNIKEALFKLDDFCNANKIEYTVTGTVALAMLGIPSEPNDIDIKVFHLKEEQETKLKELQFLSSLGKENYEGSKCYSFMIGETKVNAIIDNIDLSQEVTLSMFDETYAKRHSIRVQLVFPALIDKMKLKRHKDKTYMLNLIANLAQL